MAETASRPFSISSSVISPYAALEALASSSPTRSNPNPHPGSSPRSQRTGKARAQASTSGQEDLGEQEEDEDDDDIPFLVRARFDFEATDESALSFNAGDLIYVYARLESGWWDGMLDGKRGWFPSNYVEDIAEEDLAQLEHEHQDGEATYEDGEGRHLDGRGRGEGGGGGSEEDVLRMDDVLRGQWGDWGGDAGLEDLAREMMAGDDEDDAGGFEAEARRRRAQVEGLSLGADEFGVSARKREETDATIRAVDQPSIRRESGSNTKEAQGGPQDAWIPSLTPDGQVYYHNTHTGEDSWELPMENSGLEDEQLFGELPTDEQYFNSITSSSAPSTSTLIPPETPDDNNNFRAPPRAQNDIPYPWVARLSDDGREWFYHNRLTGQSRRDPPTTKGDASSMVDIGVGLKRLSVSSSGPRPLRASVELQRRAVEEWERKISDALQAATRPKDKPTMGSMMDIVNDSLREIFEAAVAGSAAEEEMSRAVDLGSGTGMAAAIMREESAVEMLASAHAATLSVIRDLLRAFGYVGPLDKMEEMPRPHWVGDMTLIGSIGLLSANIHAAVVSKRAPDSGLSVWAEVMRSASKLKDVIANFPGAVLSNSIPPGAHDDAEGKRLTAWLGFESLGEPLGGTWGFGKADKGLRILDQSAVVDCQKVRDEFDTAIRDTSNSSRPLGLIRIAAKFGRVVSEIDIASVIDVDGDTGDLGRGVRAREDDLREYDHLVDQARQALQDLDSCVSGINSASIQVMQKLESDDIEVAIDHLVSAVFTAFRALSTLLIISGEQAAAVEQGLIRGQIGVRSAKYIASHTASTRPTSMGSSTSRTSTSRRSEARRSRVRGIEDEFMDDDDYGEMRDQAGEMQPPSTSASASTTSLSHQQNRHSATSSTTSLAYPPSEADSGSQKGNRTSILKAFRRNRSGSDADDGRGSGRGKTPNKKLAKIFGEDVTHIPVHPSIPPPSLSAPPTVHETPWYLSDDFEEGEIIFDDKGGVKAGTLTALVIRLTQHSSTDTPFFQAFLLTFRSFTNGAELFDLLVKRYNIAPPDGLTPSQAHEWKVKKQAPIRLRVANALRTWLERHYIEQTDSDVLDKIEQFATTTLLANGSELMSKQLLTLVAKRRIGEPEQTRGSTSGSLLSPPAPLLPRVTGRQLRLTDIAPLEIARQLTIIEFVHFQRIKPSECLNRAWAEDGGSNLAPNVRNVILTANRMAGWVALHILSSKDVRQRATAMKILIQVAAECRNLNNFSSMAGIIAGLNSAPITRLKRTRDLLSVKTQNMKADLDKTLDSSKNFANYKDLLKTINPPCVPFFGFYLSALTFIEDGNKNFIQPGAPTKGMTTSTSSSSLASSANRPSPLNPLSSSTSTSTTNNGAPAGTVIPTQPLINFFKRSLNAEILRDISQYQSQPYNLARCRSVVEWINKGLDEVEKGGDLYELSQALEPREKEEERITRMLHDSGFI